MKIMEPYRTSPELKSAYDEVMWLCAKHKAFRLFFFDLWATSPNQNAAMKSQRFIDTWLKDIEEDGIIALERMDSLIEQEILEYPFRANCWRYEI